MNAPLMQTSDVVPPRLTLLRCLFLLGMHHGVQIPADRLLGIGDRDPVRDMLRLMGEFGLTGKSFARRKWKDLVSLGSAFPTMAEMKGGYWVIVANAVPTTDNSALLVVLDPRNEQAGMRMVARDEFEVAWAGRLVLCKRRPAAEESDQRFGMMWFVKEVMRDGHYLRDVAIAALMSTAISFSTPLFFNIMIDRVVPHHSYETLFAIVIAFVVVTAFDGVFVYLRQWLMLFATNKIDARVAVRTFNHLLQLPMHFFEKTTAGVLLRHMQQTEVVRNFLTGRLFQVMLDALTLPILLVGLAFYSGLLTMVVLVFSLAIAGVIGVMIPAFRRQLERLYQAEAGRQSDLVETIHGMRAVKSLALENLRRKSWSSKVASVIRRRASVAQMGFVAMVVTNFLEKAMTITVLGLGCVKVFDGDLSIGALVAFNMISGRVTGPLLQIVTLINEYQQTALSLKMLGEVMDHPPERPPGQRGIRPPITGDLEFDHVTFRYEGTVSPALSRVSFRVEEGKVIGIVGRSGSGKTTITRLIQGIHTPQEGLIRLNGNDVRHIDLSHLRRSIGVVLQDNILFRGTIRDNIAAARPEAPLEEVMEAARLAGADEFIDRLPQSYETLIGEHGANFSGGQRQRMAIARALLSRPQLLIFDEATSALDPESEAIIQQNLAEIARGRTMVIVSHRLSSLVDADAILVLDRGCVVDFAPHAELLRRCQIFSHLWQQQTRHLQ